MMYDYIPELRVRLEILTNALTIHRICLMVIEPRRFLLEAVSDPFHQDIDIRCQK